MLHEQGLSIVKHGIAVRAGDRQRVEWDELELAGTTERVDLLSLNEALAKLEKEEPEKAGLVKLRYFAGFSVEEAAEALGISRTTASRYWTYARTWLYAELKEGLE